MQVTVYRLLCPQTCEERVRYFAERKLALHEELLRDPALAKRLECDPTAGLDAACARHSLQTRRVLLHTKDVRVHSAENVE